MSWVLDLYKNAFNEVGTGHLLDDIDVNSDRFSSGGATSDTMPPGFAHLDNNPSYQPGGQYHTPALASGEFGSSGSTNTGGTTSTGGGASQADISSAVSSAMGEATGSINNHTTTDGNATRGVVTDGFAGMGQQFDNVNSNLNTVNDNMGAGFNATLDSMGQGFQTTNDNLNSGLQGVVDNANTNTQTVVDNTNAGFASTAEQLTAAQAAILGGQSNLDQLLQNTGQRLDTYYGGLADGQSAVQGSLGNLQSDFNDYNTQYTKDAAAGVQSRADIQEGMMNQTDRIRNEVGSGLNAVQTGQQNLMRAVGGGFASPSTAAAAAPAANSAPAPQQQNPQQQVGAKMAAIKPLLGQAVANPGIHIDLRRNFDQVAKAFDDAGNLIANSREENGTIVSRAMDKGGNLLLQRFDARGGIIGNHSLNLEQTVAQLSNVLSGTGF